MTITPKFETSRQFCQATEYPKSDIAAAYSQLGLNRSNYLRRIAEAIFHNGFVDLMSISKPPIIDGTIVRYAAIARDIAGPAGKRPTHQELGELSLLELSQRGLFSKNLSHQVMNYMQQGDFPEETQRRAPIQSILAQPAAELQAAKIRTLYSGSFGADSLRSLLYAAAASREFLGWSHLPLDGTKISGKARLQSFQMLTRGYAAAIAAVAGNRPAPQAADTPKSV